MRISRYRGEPGSRFKRLSNCVGKRRFCSIVGDPRETGEEEEILHFPGCAC
jgi:hypothetical protein